MLAKLLHSLMLALSYVPKVCLLPSVDKGYFQMCSFACNKKVGNNLDTCKFIGINSKLFAHGHDAHKVFAVL